MKPNLAYRMALHPFPLLQAVVIWGVGGDLVDEVHARERLENSAPVGVNEGWN